MYRFFTQNNMAIPAKREIVYTINEREIRVPIADESQKERIIARLDGIPYTIVELDAPPDELAEALKGKKFTGGRELDKFISDWQSGALPESRIKELENKIKEQQRIIDEMINYEAVN